MQRMEPMTETEQAQTVDSASFVESKFGRVLLTILSVALIFAGPTYVIYGLAVVMGLNAAVSFVIGFVLFAFGLILMRYLVQKRVIV